jgi:hypothetical protein
MSHVVSQTLDLKDLDCLRAACEELGLEIRAKKNYRWYGRSVGDYPIPEGFTVDELGKCEFAIGIKGDTQAYEIGAVKKGGQWRLIYDFWGPGQALAKQKGKGAACTRSKSRSSRTAAPRPKFRASRARAARP